MNDTEIKVILAGNDDTEALCKIEAACFSQPWTEIAFKDFFNSEFSVCFKAECSGTVCGYVGFYISACDDCDITNIAVLPQCRKNGIANKLMNTVISYCKSNKINKVMLEVRRSNAPAIALYEKLGFAQVGIRKNYYKKPVEDALLMDYTIPSYGETE